MSETTLDQEHVQLVREHDALLGAMSLSNSERRRLGVRMSNAEVRRRLYATGLAISQSGRDEPVYGTASEFLAANPE